MSDSEEFYDPKGDTTEEGGYSSDSGSNAVREGVLYLFYLLKRCYEMWSEFYKQTSKLL